MNYEEIIKKLEENDFSSNSVPRPGIEPGWVAPLVFETSASTDSAIWAYRGTKVGKVFHLCKQFGSFLSKNRIFSHFPPPFWCSLINFA